MEVFTEEEKLEQKAEILYQRMFCHRFDGNKAYDNGWNGSPAPKGKAQKIQYIIQSIKEGYRVRTGWFTSSVRGFHHYYILLKKYKNNKNTLT